MAKGKKNKVNLDSMSQAHGALAPVQTVQEIMGYTSGYSEASLQEYQQKIEAMSDGDLHEHAIEMGIVPTHNKVLLVDKLERQFIAAQNKFLYKNNGSKLTKESEEALRKLLRGAI